MYCSTNYRKTYWLYFKGEVWANLDPSVNSAVEYAKYGTSSHCIDSQYNHVEQPTGPTDCGTYVGKASTNYVYKVSIPYYSVIQKIK